MDLDLVISHLRANAPFFLLVGGAADYQAGLKTVTFTALPSAFVLPLEDDPENTNDMGGSYHQFITEKIGVVVEIDNTADRRGQGASSQMGAARAALFAALLKWLPDPDNQERGFEYDKGGLLDFDRARLWWQFDFRIRTLISDADCWQVAGVPLLDLQFSRPADVFTPFAHAVLAEGTP
jgi:hypothetical protein